MGPTGTTARHATRILAASLPSPPPSLGLLLAARPAHLQVAVLVGAAACLKETEKQHDHI